MERDNKKDGRAAELDRFWDIDALLPTRRVPARSRNTEAEEVTVAAKTPDATDAANPPLYHAEPLPPPAKDQENTVVHPHEAPLFGNIGSPRGLSRPAARARADSGIRTGQRAAAPRVGLSPTLHAHLLRRVLPHRASACKAPRKSRAADSVLLLRSAIRPDDPRPTRLVSLPAGLHPQRGLPRNRLQLSAPSCV